MILRTKAIVTETYKGKSKYDFWKNLQVGDTIEVSTQIRKYFRGGNGLNATNLTIKNERSGEIFKSTMSMTVNYLYQIKYKEIDEQL
jgi:hypothetical protein